MDELRSEIEQNRVFSGFNEGRLNFLPTFKVMRSSHLSPDFPIIGTGVDGVVESLDGSPMLWSSGRDGQPCCSNRFVQYNSQRIPAYCDRVLWKSRPMHESHVKQRQYGSTPTYGTSDHKPVYSTFDVVLPPPRWANALPVVNAGIGAHNCTIKFRKIEVHYHRNHRSPAGPLLSLSNWSGNSSSDHECRGTFTNGSDSQNSDDREVVGLGLMDQLKRLGSIPAGGAMQLMFAGCLLYTSPSPRDQRGSRMPSSA